MLESRAVLQNGIQIRRHNADLLYGCSARATAARSAAAIGQTSSLYAAVYTQAAVDTRHLSGGAGDAPQRATCLLPFQRGLRQQRPVTVDFQIQIVFDRQRQSILHGQV